MLGRNGMHYVTDDGVTLDALAPEEPLLADGTNGVNKKLGGPAARMLAAGAGVEADVLKVGHHGSAYSSTPAFIAAVRPRYALISVGRRNLFGIPRRLH